LLAALVRYIVSNIQQLQYLRTLRLKSHVVAYRGIRQRCSLAIFKEVNNYGNHTGKPERESTHHRKY
jgi:hypothetical protein